MPRAQTTLMSRVCAQTLGQPSNSVDCQQWFTNALSHCANGLVITERPNWMYRLLQTLWNSSDNREPEMVGLFMLDEQSTGAGQLYKTNAFLLDQFECQSLLYSVAEDYVEWTGRRQFDVFHSNLMAIGLLVVVLLAVGVTMSVCMCNRWCARRGIRRTGQYAHIANIDNNHLLMESLSTISGVDGQMALVRKKACGTMKGGSSAMRSRLPVRTGRKSLSDNGSEHSISGDSLTVQFSATRKQKFTDIRGSSYC